MGHELIKATLIPDVIKMIQDEYLIPEDVAFDRFFRSITYIIKTTNKYCVFA